MRRTLTLIVASLLALPVAARAQVPAAAPAAPRPAAKADDVRSADAIIAALYDVISGEKGQQRDWDRFRSLFIPGARLIPTGRRPADSVSTARVLDVEDYVKGAGPGLEGNGFFEREIGSRSDSFGGIVQRFSAYDSRRSAADPKPFARGINSIQLFNDGKRWYVVTIYWESETPANQIPVKYLSGSP